MTPRWFETTSDWEPKSSPPSSPLPSTLPSKLPPGSPAAALRLVSLHLHPEVTPDTQRLTLDAPAARAVTTFRLGASPRAAARHLSDGGDDSPCVAPTFRGQVHQFSAKPPAPPTPSLSLCCWDSPYLRLPLCQMGRTKGTLGETPGKEPPVSRKGGLPKARMCPSAENRWEGTVTAREAKGLSRVSG